MKIIVFGREGCIFCEAAKEKLQLLGLSYDYIDIEHPGEDWRDSGAVDALAWYHLRLTLPAVRVDGVFMDYPEAMKFLKGKGSG